MIETIYGILSTWIFFSMWNLTNDVLQDGNNLAHMHLAYQVKCKRYLK